MLLRYCHHPSALHEFMDKILVVLHERIVFSEMFQYKKEYIEYY